MRGLRIQTAQGMRAARRSGRALKSCDAGCCGGCDCRCADGTPRPGCCGPDPGPGCGCPHPSAGECCVPNNQFGPAGIFPPSSYMTIEASVSIVVEATGAAGCSPPCSSLGPETGSAAASGTFVGGTVSGVCADRLSTIDQSLGPYVTAGSGLCCGGVPIRARVHLNGCSVRVNGTLMEFRVDSGLESDPLSDCDLSGFQSGAAHVGGSVLIRWDCLTGTATALPAGSGVVPTLISASPVEASASWVREVVQTCYKLTASGTFTIRAYGFAPCPFSLCTPDVPLILPECVEALDLSSAEGEAADPRRIWAPRRVVRLASFAETAAVATGAPLPALAPGTAKPRGGSGGRGCAGCIDKRLRPT